MTRKTLVGIIAAGALLTGCDGLNVRFVNGNKEDRLNDWGVTENYKISDPDEIPLFPSTVGNPLNPEDFNLEGVIGEVGEEATPPTYVAFGEYMIIAHNN